MDLVEYTPNTQSVSHGYAAARCKTPHYAPEHDAEHAGYIAEFHRWLARHDRELAERIAAKIESRADWAVSAEHEAGLSAFRDAARIARGEAT